MRERSFRLGEVHKMFLLPTTKKMSNLVIISLLFLVPSYAMTYQEPLEINDMDGFFGNDGCIEGTLSATETGSPVIRSYVDVNPHTTIKHSEKNNTSEKLYMSLLSELATFNKIKYLYKLIEEYGPSHKKRFVISLDLGGENYVGEGTSIKRAQHEAARLALESTSFEHPPEKPKKNEVKETKSNPVQKLYSWAEKHGEVEVTYTYSDIDHSNCYHQYMYMKKGNSKQVKVRVLDEEFVGEGSTVEQAKQDAANIALYKLQTQEGFCMFDDGTKNIIDKIWKSDSNEHSPVSLVHEFSSKSKLLAEFNLVSEVGPPHMKKFVYKCKVGELFESIGEGHNKKLAKKQAAEKMVEKLKSHAVYNEDCIGNKKFQKKQKNKALKNLIKLADDTAQKDEDSSEYHIPENIDPISKLMQLQQAKHDLEPVFSLVQERGGERDEFLIEVTVGDVSFVGSGPNKKVAKKNAAEGILKKLGYASSSGELRLHSSKEKKKEFHTDISTKKKLVPGLSINSKKFVPLKDIKKPTEYQIQKPDIKISNFDDKTHSQKQPISNKGSKKKLAELSKQLRFRFQFSDFPKENDIGYVSLVSLTTDPPKVCYGVGETTTMSQDVAAANAITSLKSQLDSISRILNEEPQVKIPLDSSIVREWYIIDGRTVVKTGLSEDNA